MCIQLNEDLMNSFSNKSFPKLNSIKYTFNGLNGNRIICSPEFRHLKTLDIVLDLELNGELTSDGVNRALIQMSELKCLEIFNIKIFVEDFSITAIDNGLKQMANNLRQLKRLDFIMDSIVLNEKLFDIFSRFLSLEFCEMSIEYNEDMTDYGLIQNFKLCLNLRVFNIHLFNICDKHLVDIDLYIPNITNFHLKSNSGITDLTFNCLKKCLKLEVIEIHTYNDNKSRLKITDSGVCQLIKDCPK